MDGIHRSAMDSLSAKITELVVRDHRESEGGRGRSVLLLAPRAGYGKTHLLATLEQRETTRATFVPLPFQPDSPPSWSRLCASLLERLRTLPVTAGKQAGSRLDQVARYFFAEMVAQGICQGLVDVPNPKSAQRYIRANHLQLFASNGSRAKWFCEAHEVLMDEVSPGLAAHLGLSEEAVHRWSRFFHEHSFGQATLKPTPTEAAARKRTRELARIASAAQPLIFVADHLDGLHGEDGVGHRIAHLLADLAEFLPRSLTILSANQDLWKSLFISQIPSALEDRLAWEKLHLEPLSISQAERLILHRIADCGLADHEASAFLDTINLASVSAAARDNAFTPRTLIRYARRMWEGFDPKHLVPPDSKTVPFPTESKSTEKKPKRGSKLAPAEKLAAVADAIRQQTAQRAGPESSLLADEPNRPKKSSVAERFHELRLKHASRDSLAYHPQRAHRLLREVGANFATIRQTEMQPPDDSDGQALRWDAKDREILLGFAPPSSARFWQNLAELAQKRDENNDRESKKAWVKLALLSPCSEPFPLKRLFRDRRQENRVKPLVDRIEIDRELLASLYAADDLIAGSKSGSISATDAEIFGFLARELDYFWRKLTRKTGAKGGNAAAG